MTTNQSMSEEAINAISDALDELTHQCWMIVREKCNSNLPLLQAVTGKMSEIVRVNGVADISRHIYSKQEKKEEEKEKTDGK